MTVSAPCNGTTPATSADESAAELSVLQAKYLESEFGHGFVLTNRARAAVVEEIVKSFKLKKNIAAADNVLERLAKGSKVPRLFKDRAEMIFDLVLNL